MRTTVDKIVELDDRMFTVQQLTKEYAKSNSDALLLIHNIIPYVSWRRADLLSEISSTNVQYVRKWELSYVALQGDTIVGLLIAYERAPMTNHPFKAVYIHRLAIDPLFQGIGIGSSLVSYAIKQYRNVSPAVGFVSVQTNDEPRNSKVLSFYESLGFKKYMNVHYPDKLDVLMLLSQ